MTRYACAGGLAALTSIFFGLTAAEPSIAVAYCASINTAGTSANSSTFQSEGLCFDFCNDDGYALGVLQASDCWCSNYIPDSGDRVATSEWCVLFFDANELGPFADETYSESSCPGYPSDYCGGDNLYGYIQLSAAASGTKGGTSSTTSSTSSSSTTVSNHSPWPCYQCFCLPAPVLFPATSVFYWFVSEMSDVDEWSLNDFGIQTTETSIAVPTKTVTETIQASVTTSSSESHTTSTSLTSPQSAEILTSTAPTDTDVCYFHLFGLSFWIVVPHVASTSCATNQTGPFPARYVRVCRMPGSC